MALAIIMAIVRLIHRGIREGSFISSVMLACAGKGKNKDPIKLLFENYNKVLYGLAPYPAIPANYQR